MRNSDTELVRYLVLKDPDKEQVLEQKGASYQKLMVGSPYLQIRHN